MKNNLKIIKKFNCFPFFERAIFFDNIMNMTSWMKDIDILKEEHKRYDLITRFLNYR